VDMSIGPFCASTYLDVCFIQVSNFFKSTVNKQPLEWLADVSMSARFLRSWSQIYICR